MLPFKEEICRTKQQIKLLEIDKEIKIDFKQNPTIPELPDIKHKLNEVVENFGSRIPSLKIEFARVVEGYRKKIGAIEL